MRILVVDDSAVFLTAASDALEEAGFEVEVANNGSEGIRMARQNKPDLIVMDIEMPIMRGDHAAREIRCDPQLRDIPIIAMTSVSPETLGEDRKLFNDYLIKPFGFREILPMVKNLIGK